VTIGILTSGGDAPGMNAVIAGACEEAERLGRTALGVRSGFAGLAARRAEPITALQARTHMHEPGTWLETSRWPQLREASGRALCSEAAEQLGLEGLVVIGKVAIPRSISTRPSQSTTRNGSSCGATR